MVLLQSASTSASNAGASFSSKQENTYTAVKGMVEQMIAEIQKASADEHKHKAWCDSELVKNRKVLGEKGAKLKISCMVGCESGIFQVEVQ